MRALTMLATGYPGPYVPPGPGNLDNQDPTALFTAMAPGIGLLVFSMVAVIGVIAVFFSAEAGSETGVTIGVFVVLGGLIGLICVGIGIRDSTRTDSAADAKHRAAYDQTLVDWLADDYGIDTDVASITRLMASETFVTEYDGRQVSISISDTLDGSKVLVDENRAPLTVLGGN